ncbi:MAG: hydrolase TatD [Bacteroidetes bacterium]|nr:hydrolase TatD [Bacteroidota bacterium]
MYGIFIYTRRYVKFINIHTHHEEKDAVSILNIFTDVSKITEHKAVSTGIHPWQVQQEDVQQNLTALRANATHAHVKAIGECGLDRLATADLALQTIIFSEQIKIAEAVKKPLIIHCVKAFDELIRIKKEQKIMVPMIVHGYNNNAIIADQLLQNGFMLSFGKALLQENSNAQKMIKTVDCTNFFLETDDSEISISVIYEKAAGLKNISVEELKEKMMLNFKRLFIYE